MSSRKLKKFTERTEAANNHTFNGGNEFSKCAKK